MPSKKVLMYGGIFLAGVVLAGQVRKLPLLSKLPTV
jgi:hypothetical protein